MSATTLEPTATGTNVVEIVAVDLQTMPETAPLWRRRRSLGSVEASDSQFPKGRPSLMGYWLTEEPRSTLPAGVSESPYSIRVTGRAESATVVETKIGVGRPPLTIKLKELTMTIWETKALVITSSSAWSEHMEPALLAICQCWRFHAIDAMLDTMTDASRNDLSHASMSVLSSFRQRKRLLAQSRSIRELLLDQPHFAGPLTDPYAFLRSDRDVETYRSVAGKLHLEEWSESIDERAEGVEDTYASVTEKLFEYRNYLGGSTLEIIIVVILLIDLFINTMSYLEY